MPPRLLRNARLADGGLVDVTVEDGRIAVITDAGGAPGDAAAVEDLDGWLLLPAMAEPHAHLDKALTVEQIPNPAGDLLGAITAWTAAAANGVITHDDTVRRATEAMELLLVHGVTAVRTHANVGAQMGVASLAALHEARQRMAGLIDMQVVALVSSPVSGPEGAGNRAALAQALEVGVDLVGGCPHLDPDGGEMIGIALDAAEEAGIGVDLHVDEMLDPSVLTLRDLATQVIDRGFAHEVAASHCVTLGMQPPHVQADVASLVAQAGVAVIPLPQTNLFLQGRDRPTATPRGLTALDALLDAGVAVAAGADNVQDPFNLVGRSDPLETAALLVLAGHRMPGEAYELISEAARGVMGLPSARVEVGAVADLVAIDAPSVRGAIAQAPMSRRTYRRGTLVASTDQQSRIHWPS